MHYLLELAYEGTAYHGWQRQPNALSVQEVLEKALSTLCGEPVNANGCGRTDTGVHATQFFADFNTNRQLETRHLVNLNSLLPYDIAVYSIQPVGEEFSSRFDAVSRTYQYLVYKHKDPFLKGRGFFLHGALDVPLMNQAASVLLEYEDFEAFSKVHTDVKHFRCQLMEAVWREDEHRLWFTVSANRFLRNMVRAMVGTLVEVGQHKLSLDELRQVIENRNRSLAGQSVPACGLYLVNVRYPDLKFPDRSVYPR